MRWDRMYNALACLHNWPIHEVTACCGCKSALLDYWKWWSQSRRRRRREPTAARWVCSATRFDTHPRDTDPIYIYIYRWCGNTHPHTQGKEKAKLGCTIYSIWVSSSHGLTEVLSPDDINRWYRTCTTFYTLRRDPHTIKAYGSIIGYLYVCEGKLIKSDVGKVFL